MNFKKLYEDDQKKKTDAPQITIDTILNDLDGIHRDKGKFIDFLNKINRPGQQPERSFTYGGDGKNNGSGGKSVSYTLDRNSKQPSDDFRKIMAKIKDGHPNWKKEIESCIDSIATAKQQEYIKSFFIPKLEDPGINLTTRSMKYGDTRIAGVDHYNKMGKAMVFYCGRCVSKLSDADTKIGVNKFKKIMQGCFGAAPDANREDDDYLTQFMTLEPKMKIDAAKNVINSIRVAGTNDIQGVENESYYTGLSYVMNMLFEADEKESGTTVECPKSIDEFSKNVGTALKQAKAVSEKYPKQYKLWYEKLRSAFEKGVEEYQKLERNPNLAKDGIENPITHEIEHRNGKAWGAGGPAAFIRNHEDLKNITDQIRKGTPGVEGVNGWDIFNCGPKMILTMIDALEKGGNIYQHICDDIGEGMRQMKKSFGGMQPRDFDRLIKQYSDNHEHNEAMAVSFSAVMTGIAGLYSILANGEIGTINEKMKTFNTKNVNGQTVIQNKIDDLKTSIARLTKEEEDFDKWVEAEEKKKENRKKEIEAELKKYEETPAQNASYKPEVSIKSIIQEAEEQKETSRQKEVESKKKELEDLDKNYGKKVSVNISNYIAVLDHYKQTLSLQPTIKTLYEYIRILFNPDYAEEQYAERSNQTTQETSNEEEEKTESVKYDPSKPFLDNLKAKFNTFNLFEADNDETVDPDEDTGDDTDEKPASKNTSDDTPEFSKNEGNIDWIKAGSGKSMREIYRMFAEDERGIRVNVSKFTELAKSKKPREDVKELVGIFRNLFETLRPLDIRPITDGVVALNKVDMAEMKSKQGAISIIEFKKEGNADNEEQNNEQPNGNKEKVNKLISFISPESNIMKNTVGRLNEIYKSGIDDSWLGTYTAYQKEFDGYAQEVYKYLVEAYPEGKPKEMIDNQFKKMNGYNFITKLWSLISFIKQIALSLNKAGQKAEAAVTNTDDSILTEASPIEHQVISVNALVKSVDANPIDFNKVFLPTDFKNKVYDITKPETFNNLEKQLAERILGTRATGSGLVSMARQLLYPRDKDENGNEYNKFKKILQDKNCGKTAELLDMSSKSKNIQGNDRDVYLLLGAVWCVKNALNKYIKGDERAEDFSGKKGTGREVAKHAELNAENYIPQYSKDSLINEIYKYIKG